MAFGLRTFFSSSEMAGGFERYGPLVAVFGECPQLMESFEKGFFLGTPRGNRFTVCFALLMILGTVGCFGLPSLTELRFTTKEPNKANLVGIWVPDKWSLTEMKDRGGYDSAKITEIVLSEDNSFRVVNMPDWLDASFGDSSHEFYSDAGAWTVSEDGKLWVVVLKSSHRLTRFNLVEQEPPYRLYLTLGDPDSRQAMTFVKKK